MAKAQVLVRLQDLLTCQRFGAFLHVVTPEEEVALGDNRLRKLLPFTDMIKRRCLEYYQLTKYLCIDERMVKSKSRSHLIQYMRNKPVKWGFKLWVMSDTTGYTLDFDIYTGKSEKPHPEHGLAYNVVQKLIAPYRFQGYYLFNDNFYTSTTLLQDLYTDQVYCTGTFRPDRKDVPVDVKALKEVLSGKKAQRGTGYYIQPRDSCLVYTCWRDTRPVCVMSTAFPGHGGNMVTRKKTNQDTGSFDMFKIPRPLMVEKYNAYMGGVDKSDQFLAYHNVLSKHYATGRHCSTI